MALDPNRPVQFGPRAARRVGASVGHTERHDLARYNGSGPAAFAAALRRRHGLTVKVTGDDSSHEGLWPGVVRLVTRSDSGAVEWADGDPVWLIPADPAGSLTVGQHATAEAVEYGGPDDDPRLILAVGGGGGGGAWFYAELFDRASAPATPGGGEVNADALGYKLVRRKLVGTGKWADDGDPFPEFNAYAAEPFEGFAGTFRVRNNAAGEPSGRGLLVLARESPTEPGSYEFTPVVPEWSLWVVTARTPRSGPPNNLTPPLYTVRLTELIRDLDTGTAGNQEGWREVSPAVELAGCIRAPMREYDESRLSELRPPLQVGTVVQVRPSPTDAGRYELYGASLNKVRVEMVVATCSQCHDPGSGVRVIRTKNAKRTLTIAGADFVMYWEPAGTPEGGIRDNTAGQYQPPFDLGT